MIRQHSERFTNRLDCDLSDVDVVVSRKEEHDSVGDVFAS
jgi:hypothetical protein